MQKTWRRLLVVGVLNLNDRECHEMFTKKTCVALK